MSEISDLKICGGNKTLTSLCKTVPASVPLSSKQVKLALKEGQLGVSGECVNLFCLLFLFIYLFSAAVHCCVCRGRGRGAGGAPGWGVGRLH